MKIAYGLIVAAAVFGAPAVVRAQVVRPAIPPANRLPTGGIVRPETASAPTPLPTGAALQAALAGAASKRHRVAMGPHTFYGTIAALDANTLQLRLRSGRLVAVETAFAISSDNYSAPLFVGKTVAVDGAAGADGKFTANHIFRIEGIATTPIDK